MMKAIDRRWFLAGSVGLGLGAVLVGRGEGQTGQESLGGGFPKVSPERLEAEGIIARARELEPQVIPVTEGVFAAIGFGLANMAFLLTGKGMVVIDTLEGEGAASRALKALPKELLRRPVEAVVYTHHHDDHILGTPALGLAEGMPVIAQSGFIGQLERQKQLGPAASARAAAMFGLVLPPSQKFPDISAYPFPTATTMNRDVGGGKPPILPNRTFDETFELELPGLELQLYHVPGETADMAIAYLPSKRLVHCADNFYPNFPNLYSIRGTPPRSPLEWARAMDRILELSPAHLLPGHGVPISGEETIREVLTDYRDAILFTNDEALKAVQRMEPLESLISRVRLPEKLAQKAYLKEYYGYLPYCLRAAYASYIGWFDGDPVNLSPLTKKELGRELIELAGSSRAVLSQARRALSQGRPQAALELSRAILDNEPDNAGAAALYEASLKALSLLSANPPTVNYLKSFAEAKGAIEGILNGIKAG
mgnify:CR=1 FL=1